MEEKGGRVCQIRVVPVADATPTAAGSPTASMDRIERDIDPSSSDPVVPSSLLPTKAPAQPAANGSSKASSSKATAGEPSTSHAEEERGPSKSPKGSSTTQATTGNGSRAVSPDPPRGHGPSSSSANYAAAAPAAAPTSTAAATPRGASTPAPPSQPGFPARGGVRASELAAALRSVDEVLEAEETTTRRPAPPPSLTIVVTPTHGPGHFQRRLVEALAAMAAAWRSLLALLRAAATAAWAGLERLRPGAGAAGLARAGPSILLLPAPRQLEGAGAGSAGPASSAAAEPARAGASDDARREAETDSEEEDGEEEEEGSREGEGEQWAAAARTGVLWDPALLGGLVLGGAAATVGALLFAAAAADAAAAAAAAALSVLPAPAPARWGPHATLA